MATQTRHYLAIVGLALLVVLITTRPRPQPFVPGGCGPTSLYALCRQLGFQVRFEDVLDRFGDQKGESDFTKIKQVANLLGVPLEGREMSMEMLKQMHAPGIMHLDGNHFVAALEYTECGVRIADPLNGGQSHVSLWTYPELRERWDGRMLVIKSDSTQVRH
jgi:ABC-type bacteriocin/lantibiotic exporter with double-glycine peptidase domain